MARKFSIPDYLSHLPTDKHGYPITAVTTIKEDGTPDFTMVDEVRVLDVVLRGKNCGICGEGLDYWITFLGGPKAAENRRYFDPPMHERCARFSAAICPFIAIPNMLRRKTVSEGATTPQGMELKRPDYYVMYVTRTFKVLYQRDGIVFQPAPAKRLETLEETRAS